MLKIFATFLKKGSAKNFPTGKVLGCFSKKVRSTEICSRLSVLLFILSGYAAWILISQTSSLAVGTADLFWKKALQKTFLQKGFWEFSKKVRSTVVSNRRAFFYFNYAIGVWSFKFNIATPEFACRCIPTEFGCRHCRPFSCERRGTAIAVDE